MQLLTYIQITLVTVAMVKLDAMATSWLACQPVHSHAFYVHVSTLIKSQFYKNVVVKACACVCDTQLYINMSRSVHMQAHTHTHTHRVDINMITHTPTCTPHTKGLHLTKS